MVTPTQEFNLYIHVPFCERICIYCDFYVTTARKYFQNYTDSVVKEIELIAEKYHRPAVETIYFGGGTPSYLPEEQLKNIIDRIFNSFHVAAEPEITVEANPNNLTLKKLKNYRSMGINRLSIGVQSFRNSELKFLTRNHDARQAGASLRNARKAGFENISLDLIFGLPDQTLQNWRYNLVAALHFRPEHISIYNLTVEERTHLHKLVQQKKIVLQDEEIELKMFLETIEILNRAGYEQYEISNYAKPGYRSRHNSSYWMGSRYLGLGPSAHSFDGKRRWWNVSNVMKYTAQLNDGLLPVESDEILTPAQRSLEAILLGLRTAQGLSIPEFEKLTGKKFERQFASAIGKTRNYLRIKDGFVTLTNEGFFLYNKICEEFGMEISAS